MSEDSRGRHDDGKLLYCSFCGKSQHEVRKLIAGPSVFICDECIELCNDIIREESHAETAGKGVKSDLPVPHAIRESLESLVLGKSDVAGALRLATKSIDETLTSYNDRVGS